MPYKTRNLPFIIIKKPLPLKIYIFLLLSLLATTCFPQNEEVFLNKEEVQEDLKILDELLQNKSSYQGLNGYDYQKDFKSLLERVDNNPITQSEFGLFLTRTIGKIGDRHANVKGYDLPESLYFPFTFAPLEDKIVVVQYNRSKKQFGYWNKDFPYLKAINDIPIAEILPKIRPEDAMAPEKSYTLRAVRDLRDIETVFAILDLELPNPISITLTTKNGDEKEVNVTLVSDDEKAYLWDERFGYKNFFLNEAKRNDPDILKSYFSLDENIGYIQIVDMFSREDSPPFFQLLREFMEEAKNSKALIVDVRNNGGGTRDLVQELAGYFVHPDSVYVVNATRQRGELPLNVELKERLNLRYLFSRDELTKREQNKVDAFMASFVPMYDLDDTKYSDYHYYILNGQKLSQNKYHYQKPIYIMANERTFSAASLFVSVLKDLPNIKVVGVTTDGSSGNSERFELPNSGVRGKISTMVSYQRNGKILDGIGTEPDIVIERNLDQAFFTDDYQLSQLKEVITDK